MNERRLELIPDELLAESGTGGLREWLYARGWRLSLLELVNERRARGLASSLMRAGHHHPLARPPGPRKRRRQQTSQAVGSGPTQGDEHRG